MDDYNEIYDGSGFGSGWGTKFGEGYGIGHTNTDLERYKANG